MESECKQIIEILVPLLAGAMNCDDARAKIETISMDKFSNIFANLNHYYDDVDIRAKDQEYKELQDGELKKLIHHLKSGEIEKANEISFLHES